VAATGTVRVSRPARTALRFATVAVLLAFAVFAWVKLEPSHSGESLCDQAKVLRTARLLNESQQTYARAEDQGHDCVEAGSGEEPPLATVESELAVSEASLAKAKLLSAGKEIWPAIRFYVPGLATNPFAVAGGPGLDAVLGELPVLTRKSKFLPAVAENRCRLGVRLTRAGLLDAAETSIAGGLKLAPKRCRKATGRLARRAAHAAALLRQGRRLSGEGETEPARTQYAKALRVDSDLSEARTELEGSAEEESDLDAVGSWLTGIPDTLKNSLLWFVPLALILLVAALGLWIAVRELSAHWLGARRAFEKIGAARGFSFFQNAAVPEVTIADFEGESAEAKGKDFSALLKAAMGTQAGREPAFPYDRLSKGTEPDAKLSTDVAAVLAEVPETKLLGSLIQVISKLFRRRSILLRGHLAPATDQGAGVLIVLEGNGKDISGSCTLWENEFDPLPGGKNAARWLRLVPAATAWGRWHLADAYSRPKTVECDSWRGDALFKSAQAWQALEDFPRAAALYADALEREPQLLSAAHNLAVIEIRNGQYERAKERLLSLRTTLLDPANTKLREQWPTLDTASLYTLALALVYPAVKDAADQTGDIAEALSCARMLVREVSSQLDDPKLAKAARKTLETTEGPSVVLLASLTARSDPKLRAEAAEAVAEGRLSRQVSRRALREEVERLKPWELIDGYVLKEPETVTRRTHYNLACYYVNLMEKARCGAKAACQKQALAALERSLLDDDLASWAGKDPSLESLRKASPAEFATILAIHRIEPHGDDAGKAEDAKPGSPPTDVKAAATGLTATLRKAFGSWLLNDGK
jgi:tetratricopeptide (TPR) repeat protein